MPPREDDDVAPRPGVPNNRTLIQAGGFLLAAGATLAVLLTDDAQLLKLAVVAVAWAFVLATFAAGRRGTDRLTATVRERELRRSYEQELEREVAARHEYELELENELRRETEDSMRYELDGLRREMAALSGLREEVARVSALRDDLAGLTALRDELARVAALGDEVAALNALRQELGQLGELRADMGRLRAELTEQLSSELLVERIVMRTQAGRLGAENSPLDQTPAWADDVPPRELTGGWPAIRLDEPRETRQFEQVRVERSGPRPPLPAAAEAWTWDAAPEPPAQDRWSALTDPALAEQPRWPAEQPRRPAEEPSWASAPPTAAAPAVRPPEDRPVPYRREYPPTAMTPIVTPPPVEPPPSPLEWLSARSLLDPAPAAPRPEVPVRLRPEVPPPAVFRPEVPPVRSDEGSGYRVVTARDPEPPPRPQPPRPQPPTTGPTRVADILAENGVAPTSGGRRRRRYREDDDADDVLARVLRQN
jgi:hypothetical protein